MIWSTALWCSGMGLRPGGVLHTCLCYNTSRRSSLVFTLLRLPLLLLDSPMMGL